MNSASSMLLTPHGATNAGLGSNHQKGLVPNRAARPRMGDNNCRRCPRDLRLCRVSTARQPEGESLDVRRR
jgi:hypothetical protein